MIGNNDFTRDELVFDYLNLNKYLYAMHRHGINNINLYLYVSPENLNYHGEHLKSVMVDLKNLLGNFVFDFDGEVVKFRVNKILLNVGDVLNRYNSLYRYYRDYLIENNLDEENQIPENIRQEIMKKSYSDGKQLGKDWFRDEFVDAFNLIVSNNKIKKDLVITDGITKIYPGDDIIPEIEYICHEYWLKHPDFEKTKKALDETRHLKNSIIERTYNHEIEFFLETREQKYGKIPYPEIFKKCSKLYFIDESVEYILIQQQFNNNLIFYCEGCELQHNKVFAGRKAKNNEVIRKYLANELRGVTNGNWITIKDKKN